MGEGCDYADMRLYQDTHNCHGYQSYYTTLGVRAICHAVKQHEDLALRHAGIQVMVDHMANRLVMSGAAVETTYLVPAPQHYGYADYTLEIANLVAMATGASVLDVVRCKPHESSYDQKTKGEVPTLEFYLTGAVPDDGRLFFVDNVISTGQTFRLMNELFAGRLVPLVFAVDHTKTDIDELLGAMAMDAQ